MPQSFTIALKLCHWAY